jgi:hypothetical protein
MMNKKIPRAAWIILTLYLAATALLLIFGYGVKKPALQEQEFPFSITYTLDGEQKTVSGVFVAEFSMSPGYLGDKSHGWFGYIRDQDLLSPDFIRIAEDETHALSINLNLEPGWLMGDSAYSGCTCAPSGHAIRLSDERHITDPAELEELGFRLDSWTYPQPIENRFSFGGISMSSESVLFTSAIAIVALLLCLICVKRDREQTVKPADKIGVVINLLVAAVAFPFILIVSALSEILGETSVMQQLLYLTPALTVAGVSASVVLRRRGYSPASFLIQFVGPVLFLLTVLIEKY